MANLASLVAQSPMLHQSRYATTIRGQYPMLAAWSHTHSVHRTSGMDGGVPRSKGAETSTINGRHPLPLHLRVLTKSTSGARRNDPRRHSILNNARHRVNKMASKPLKPPQQGFRLNALCFKSLRRGSSHEYMTQPLSTNLHTSIERHARTDHCHDWMAVERLMAADTPFILAWPQPLSQTDQRRYPYGYSVESFGSG